MLFDGVDADECEAFAAVFTHVPDCHVVAVAAAVGHVAGPGGGWTAEATFADVAEPDIVLVPGGLGCARTAADEALLGWLRSVTPHARWVVASSTGTVVVAAAGLLDHRAAATHWLAAPLLESYGSPASHDRIVEVGRVITCAGQVTAMHVALVVVGREFGPQAVTTVRAAVAAGLAAAASGTPRRTSRRRRVGRSAGGHAAPRPVNRQLAAPDVIEFDEPTVTRLR